MNAHRTIAPPVEQAPVNFRYEAAKRELRRWFEAEWQKLTAEQAAREREIERKFWAGEYR